VLNCCNELIDSLEWFNIASVAMSVAGMTTLLIISSAANCRSVLRGPSLLAMLPGFPTRRGSISFQPVDDDMKSLIARGARSMRLSERCSRLRAV
jgi:hypothetical protein